MHLIFFPLIVMIIGIGNDYFKEMIQMDGDDVSLVSCTEWEI
jgi:hypothetical protein